MDVQRHDALAGLPQPERVTSEYLPRPLRSSCGYRIVGPSAAGTLGATSSRATRHVGREVPRCRTTSYPSSTREPGADRARAGVVLLRCRRSRSPGTRLPATTTARHTGSPGRHGRRGTRAPGRTHTRSRDRTLDALPAVRETGARRHHSVRSASRGGAGGARAYPRVPRCARDRVGLARKAAQPTPTRSLASSQRSR